MSARINEKEIKHRLIDMGRTQSWLFKQVKQRTGKYCDYSYLAKICRGDEPGAAIVPAICEILDLEEKHEC